MKNIFAAAALVVVCGLGLSCQDDTTYHGANAEQNLVASLAARIDLGDLLYKYLHARLESDQSTVGQLRAGALAARKADFVNAVNGVLTADSLQQIGPALGTFLNLVDDGTLQGMAKDVATILEELVNEPSHKTLRAVLQLQNTRGVFQSRDVLQFAAQMMNYPEMEKVVAAVAEVVRLNDGVDDLGQPNGEVDLVSRTLSVASEFLASYAASSPSGPATWADAVRDELLAPAPPRQAGAFGVPAWVVIADGNGNPAVETDPATHKLYAPFVDADGDAVADVNGDGLPVDAAGLPIQALAFGIPGTPGFDNDGRALAHDSALLYRYVDAKETMLSHIAQLVGQAMGRALVTNLVELAEVTMAPRMVRDAGTPNDPRDDYNGFAPDNPVTGLLWGGLGLAQASEVPGVIRAVSDLLQQDSQLAERILVTTGRAIEDLRPVFAARTGGGSLGTQVKDRWIAILGQVLHAGGGSGRASTGRVLVEVAAQLGRTAPEFPRGLGLLMRYRKLVLDAQGNPTAASEYVDMSAPATVGGNGQIENRSSLHQLVDLIYNMETCPTVAIFGRPLVETVLEVVAGRSVGTVNTVLQLVNSPLVRGVVGFACPNMMAELDALEALRLSGTLDAFVPLVRAFTDTNETGLLLDIVRTFQQDYASVVRLREQPLADVMFSGAVEDIIDLLELLLTGRAGGPVVDPATGERAIDLAADALSRWLDHGVPAADLLGARQPSQLHLVVQPLDRIEAMLSAAGLGASVGTTFMYNLTDLFVERIVDDNGTPNDPSDDVERLQNPNLAPFLTRIMGHMAAQLPSGQSNWRSDLAALQGDTLTFMDSRELATLFDLVVMARGAPGGDVLHRAMSDMLTPDPLAQADMFSSLLRLIVSGVQVRMPTASLPDVAAFAARVLDPARSQVVGLVRAFNRMLQADQGGALVGLLRNALNPAPSEFNLPPGRSPVEVLSSVFDDVRIAGRSGPSGATTVTAQELADALSEVVNFMRDDQGGLARIFEVVKNRGR